MHQRAVAVNEIDPVRLAVGLGGQQAVARVGEEAFERIHPQIQGRAFVAVACAVDAHVAARLGQVFRHVVVEPIGADDGIAPAQFGVAFDGGVQIRLAADAVTGDEHRQLRAH